MPVWKRLQTPLAAKLLPWQTKAVVRRVWAVDKLDATAWGARTQAVVYLPQLAENQMPQRERQNVKDVAV